MTKRKTVAERKQQILTFLTTQSKSVKASVVASHLELHNSYVNKLLARLYIERLVMQYSKDNGKYFYRITNEGHQVEFKGYTAKLDVREGLELLFRQVFTRPDYNIYL